MFDRLSRSWQLVKASATVLRQDKHLMVFPLISTVAMLFVLASFALPVLGTVGLDGIEGMVEGRDGVVYAATFAFYVVQYFVIFYFNAALVGATMMRLDGGAPTVGDGLRIANSRLGPILGYAVIAATVGVILRAIQERLGFVGRFVVGLLGVGWSLATYLVVPVLVANEVGPVQAIQDSAGLLKRTWGENVIGQAGMSLAFGMMALGVLLVGIGLIVGAALLGSLVLAGLLAVLLVLSLMGLALVSSTLSGIYAAALYRYASNGAGTSGFDNAALQAAFQPKQ